MKRILSLLLAMIIFGFNLPVSAKGIEIYYDDEYYTYTDTLYKLIVNGKQLEVPLEPITFNNRSVVPVREVFEALGAKVDWDGKTREVKITGNNISVTMQIDNPIAEVNGEKTEFPGGVGPKLITKVGVVTKTMVPVRFVAEKIGLKVDWDGAKGEIIITGSVDEEPEEEVISLSDPDIEKKDSTTTVITIETDKAMSDAVKAVLTATNVLYFDIAGAKYSGAAKHEVNHASVLAVRYGIHEDYTRVAVDLTNYKSYKVETDSSKKQITITVIAKDSAATDEPTADEPTETPDEGEEEVPADEKPAETTVDIESMKDYNPSNGIKYVVIDAGHGGKDPGAIGETDGTKYNEKEITLDVARLVRDRLQAEGINVIMTRSDDSYPTLSERAVLANQNDAAMFVSIHVNSAANAPKANGIEVYYASKNNNDFYGLTSKKFAATVLDKMLEETGARSRGVKTENHLVTRSSLMPAILIELGFISNEDEIELLIDPTYQQKLADGISEGIIEHLGDITVPDRRELAKKLVTAEVGEERAEEILNEKWK